MEWRASVKAFFIQTLLFQMLKTILEYLFE
jgi:hypothetical protein